MNNVLLLNKQLYNDNNIKKSIEDFSEIVLIKCEEDEKYWKCSFTNNKASLERTMDEYENYLISLSNRKDF